MHVADLCAWSRRSAEPLAMLCLCAAFLAGCSAPSAGRLDGGGAEAISPGENVMPRQWHVLGPFPAPSDDTNDAILLDMDHLAPVGGEARMTPDMLARPVSLGSGPPLVWRSADVAGDVLDLARHLGGSGRRVGYAFTTIQMDTAATVYLMCAATGSKRVWVNGRPVYRQINERGTFDKRDSIVAARLDRGPNHILLKTTDGPRGWKMSCTLADPGQFIFRRRCDYSRGALSVSFAPDSGSAGGVLSVKPPGGETSAADGPALFRLFDTAGRTLREWRGDIAGPAALPPLGPGIYTVEVWQRYVAGHERCGLTTFAVGDNSALVRGVRERAIRWLDGPGRNDLTDRGQVLYLAEVALGRDWRRSQQTACRRPYEFRELQALLEQLDKGSVLPSKRGFFQWAFVSSAGGCGQPLSISLPPHFDPGREYPLIVFLHGSGASHLTEAVRSGPSEEPYIQISGDWRGAQARHYGGLGELDVKDAVAFMRRNYRIDPDRLYLFGHSIGAWGAWRLGSLYADQWAAVAPLAGASQGHFIENLLNVPVRAFQGTTDTITPPVYTYHSVRRLRQAGGRGSVSTYPDQGHWPFGAPGDAVEWLLQQRRDDRPQSVHFSTRNVTRGRGRHHWVQVVRLWDPHVTASVALTAAEGRLVGSVHNVQWLTIDPSKTLLGPGPQWSLEVNGRALTLAAAPAPIHLAFDRDGAYTVSQALPADVGRDPVYDEGSISTLFDGQPIRVVVPTGGDDAYQKAARSGARPLAGGFGRYGGISIEDDKDLDAQTPNAHLIVFGSPRTNRIMRQLIQWLPIELKDEMLTVRGLGTYPMTHHGFAFHYYHPRQPQYRILLFCSEDPEYLRQSHRALPDGVFNDTDTWDAAPDVVIFDMASKRYVRVACFGNDWKIAPEFRESPLLPASMTSAESVYGAVGAALREVSGADFGFTRSGAMPKVNPETMRTADLLCLARAHWGFGIVGAIQVTLRSEHLQYIAGRIHDPNRIGRNFDACELWPRLPDGGPTEDRVWTVALLENGPNEWKQLSMDRWVNPTDPLQGVKAVTGDFAAALARQVAGPQTGEDERSTR